jgi:DNA repair exonuclease SbcCD ATPase subunit
MQEREGRLSEELSQAQGNLELLRRLHQASQNQLFSMQSRSEEAAAGLQSELELATDEMERSQQRMATLEQEKASLLARLQQQQQQQAGGDGDGEAGAVAAGPAGGGGRFAEDSLRQELYAQVGVGDWKTCMPPCSVLGLRVFPALWHFTLHALNTCSSVIPLFSWSLA